MGVPGEHQVDPLLRRLREGMGRVGEQDARRPRVGLSQRLVQAGPAGHRVVHPCHP
ncbi:hypothetical protein GPEL0_01f5072 [Geoanaerobacter pelophilus]|uniref:Uncharacterized protein n=1 Tax=Geoanaerobacter pelophilus TaxID=60036 RepID=A0ABQ0MNJ8_9BACT|nr:hypothetical protein GPEL0_01f5072 [Geoanaerobacter pelophilus]